MKTRMAQFLLIEQLVLLLLLGGCDKTSSTGPGDTASTGSGSDYFPLTGNQTMTAKATGQTVAYDSLGNVMQIQAVSQQSVKGFIGSSVAVGGTQSYPLYSFSTDGTTMNATKAFVAHDNGSVVGFSSGASLAQYITALPADLKVGTTWVANPSDLPGRQFTLKVVDNKSSYTNSAGKTYSDVIKVKAAYSDSTVSVSSQDTSWSYTTFQKTNINVDICFAKGIGLVDVQVNQYESIYKYSGYYSFGTKYYFSSYNRTVTSGTIGRTN
jgi:hypothetical protein